MMKSKILSIIIIAMLSLCIGTPVMGKTKQPEGITAKTCQTLPQSLGPHIPRLQWSYFKSEVTMCQAKNTTDCIPKLIYTEGRTYFFYGTAILAKEGYVYYSSFGSLQDAIADLKNPKFLMAYAACLKHAAEEKKQSAT